MFYDEDGDLTREFYEETIVTKNGQERAKLGRVRKNLIPQGIAKLAPRMHVDFPVILLRCEPGGLQASASPASGSECGLHRGTWAEATILNELHWPGTFSCEPDSPTVLAGCQFAFGQHVAGGW